MTVFPRPGTPYWHYEFQHQHVRYRGSTKKTTESEALKFEKELRAKMDAPDARVYQSYLMPTQGYIIQARRLKMVKIGIARDVERRFKGLESMNADALELLWSGDCDYVTERKAHDLLRDHHSHSEWFQNEGLVTEFIELCKAHGIKAACEKGRSYPTPVKEE